jgi:CRP/FNR family transcriptional regulator, dissimilatory nitrate respiration regulator
MLALRTVAARLDAWCAANDGMAPARGAWRVVAAEIGVSPETLYRELARRRRSARSGFRNGPSVVKSPE